MVSEKQLNDFIEAYYSLTRFAPPPAKARWGNGSLVSVWSSLVDYLKVHIFETRTDSDKCPLVFKWTPVECV